MRYRDRTLILLGALFVFRALYILYTPLGISPDEAHYWEWSRRLGLSYYSKGPGVAYIIAFFTSVFGDNAFGIRIGAVLFSTAASCLVYLIGKDLFGSEKAGFYGAVLANVTPLFSIGAILMTTDVLLIFFWAASVLAVKRAMDGRGGWWWVAAGALIGVGFLCKYTIVFLYPSLFLFLLVSKEDRKWFKSPWPYAGGFTSLLLALPVIVWNLENGQVTIRHTMGQAHVGSSVYSLKPALEFLGAQAGLLTPLIFAGAVYGMARCLRAGFREGERDRLLAFFASAPLFLFFIFKGIHGKVQANWAVAAYITAFPASVWAFDGLSSGSRKRLMKGMAAAAIVMGAATSLLAYFPWVLEHVGLNVMSKPPYNRATGWKELGEKVSAVKREMEPLGKTFITSDTYQITSELALYTEGNPVTYNLDTGARRMNQYDLWPGVEGLKGYNAIYVRGGRAGTDGVEALFDRCDGEVQTIYWGGRPLRDYTIFRCYGFKGVDKKRNEKF